MSTEGGPAGCSAVTVTDLGRSTLVDRVLTSWNGVGNMPNVPTEADEPDDEQ